MEKNNVGKFVSSTNDELFPGDVFETEQGAIDYMVNDLPPGEDFYVGRVYEVSMLSLISSQIENFIEWIQESAAEEVGEVSEDYLSDFNKHDELAEHISGWFIKNGLEPKFFKVDDIKRYIIQGDKQVKLLS